MNFNHCLYLVSDSKYSTEVTIKAISSGIDVFQYREKNKTFNEMYELGLRYKQACKEADVLFIINDHIDLALALDADGVHLGQDDISITIARGLLPNKVIGISVTDFQEAQSAEKQGADYIGIGAMYPTNTKKDAKYVKFETLSRIETELKCQKVCIGGITTVNYMELRKLANVGLAVCSDILKDETKLCSKISIYKEQLLRGRNNEIQNTNGSC